LETSEENDNDILCETIWINRISSYDIQKHRKVAGGNCDTVKVHKKGDSLLSTLLSSLGEFE